MRDTTARRHDSNRWMAHAAVLGTQMSLRCALIEASHSRTCRAMAPRSRPTRCNARTEVRSLGGAVSLHSRGAKGQPACTDTQPRRAILGDVCRRVAPA